MNTKILSDYERKHALRYLEKNGKRVIQVRKVVSGARKHLPKIKEDVALLEKLLKAYSGEATKEEFHVGFGDSPRKPIR